MKKRQLTAATLAGVMLLTPQVAMAGTVHDDDGATITLTASIKGDQVADINQVLETASVTLAAGKVEEQGVLNVSVDALGKNWVKALTAVDTKEQKLALSLPEIDERVFTAKLSELQNISQELQGHTVLPEEIDPQKQAERYTQVFVPYMETIARYVDEWGQSGDGEIELPVLEKKLDGELVTWAPTGEQIAELTNTLADQIEADQALAELTGEWADYLEDVKSTREDAVEESTEEASDGLSFSYNGGGLGVDPKSISDKDIEAVKNFVTEAPKAMRETAQDMAKVENPGISVSVGTADDHLVLADMRMDRDEDSVNALHLENADGAYAVTVTADTEAFRLTGNYAVDGDQYSGDFALSVQGMELLTGTYAFNAATKSLIGIPYGEATLDALGVTGTLKVEAGEDGGDVHRLSLSGIDQLTDGAYPFEEVSLSLGSKQGADLEVPEGAEEDLMTYSQDQLTELAGQIGEKFLNKWAGNLLGGN